MTTPAKTYPPGVYEALDGKNYYIPFGVTVGEPATMNTQHASITARIEELDSQYREAQQIYKTTNSRTIQDNALRTMVKISETANNEGLKLPSVGLFDRMHMLQSSPLDLKQFTDNQLAYYQKSLAAHIGTPNEAKAREMNRMINSEKYRRSGYGD